jgi:hypothetical protein
MNKDLDSLMNEYLKVIAHSDLFQGIYLARDIIDLYPREEVLKNLSTPSRQQTGLVKWAHNYFNVAFDVKEKLENEPKRI